MIIQLRKIRNIFFAAVFIALLILIPLSVIHNKNSIGNIESPAEYPDEFSRISYLNLCGLKVDEESREERKITIPYEFNDTYEQYNIIQNLQGFDLSRYKGEEVMMYTYTIQNYPGDYKNMKAVLLLKDGKLIGGDIHSTAQPGFMTGLRDETIH